LTDQLGIQLNKHKNRQGEEFIFTGFHISLKNKLIRIKTDKMLELEQKASEIMSKMMVEVDVLQRFIGSLEFAAGVCPLGRVKIFYCRAGQNFL